jgi:Iron-containing redox enzyme
MRAAGLDPAYGAYLDRVPARTLATVNLMSLFGLHRRLRGAITGHLALFEATSSLPNARYARGIRRPGYDDPAATAFFDEHVEADAIHENIATVDLAGGLARQEPALAGQILWGARALLALDGAWAAEVLAAWEAGASSLRTPVAA